MKGTPVNDFAELAHQLRDLLGLEEAPVGVTFDAADADDPDPVPHRPAGCCFWEPAQRGRLDTTAGDHANCSVGSYTHGLIPLEAAAARADTGALVGSGWVSEADLVAAPALDFTPASITYQPLADAADPQVVLARLTPASLMRLHSAVPGLKLAGKPQCAIVPLAQRGTVAVSPGCAVSRTRTGLADTDMTCALPAQELPAIVERLRAAVAADQVVSAYAAADIEANFATG
ncbi:DUF169 domain-containing protein [Streptomyces sp. NPDC051985]|uniref:DUF169 domain-containing protein n=1 Tax=Streptomyces sp. NPDC051985 TaxID=3155807 RepID=UPI003436181F